MHKSYHFEKCMFFIHIMVNGQSVVVWFPKLLKIASFLFHRGNKDIRNDMRENKLINFLSFFLDGLTF